MEGLLARAVWGLVLSAGLAGVSRRLSLVTTSGAVAGLAVGWAVFLGTGPAGFACLAAFFVVGSVLTRVGYRRKAERGVAEPRGGARGAAEVLAKGAVAGVAALGTLWGLDVFRVAFVGALAAALGDTASTEVGQLGRGGAWLLFPPRQVRPGTPGAVSVLGTLAGALGSAAVAGLALGLGLVSPAGAGAAAGAGLAANLTESALRSAAGPRLGHYRMNLITTGAGAALAAGLWGLMR